MVKNKLEKLFSESLKANSSFFGMKLHNNPLAHQMTPADFLITKYFVDGFKVMLVECKQVTCEDKKGRLALKRLRQTHDLMAFENFNPNFHRAYFLIAFYDDGWLNSDLYMVPIRIMEETINALQAQNKMSISRQYARESFFAYRLGRTNGLISMEWS